MSLLAEIAKRNVSASITDVVTRVVVLACIYAVCSLPMWIWQLQPAINSSITYKAAWKRWIPRNMYRSPFPRVFHGIPNAEFFCQINPRSYRLWVTARWQACDLSAIGEKRSNHERNKINLLINYHMSIIC